MLKYFRLRHFTLKVKFYFVENVCCIFTPIYIWVLANLLRWFEINSSYLWVFNYFEQHFEFVVLRHTTAGLAPDHSLVKKKMYIKRMNNIFSSSYDETLYILIRKVSLHPQQTWVQKLLELLSAAKNISNSWSLQTCILSLGKKNLFLNYHFRRLHSKYVYH